MSDAAAGVFISYRRQEASWLAAWLHDRLVAQFGEARVFLDIDWIKPGVDFMQVIDEAIARSRVLLVIIGPQWLAAGGDGRRRLDRPDDPVRVELDTAFRRGLRVIPLLLDGANMPPAGDLPDALAGLAGLNALRVGYQSARSDLDRLVEALADELGITPDPGLPTAETAVGPGPEPRRTRSADRAAPVDVGRDEEQRARLLSRLSRTYTDYLDQSVEHDALLKLQLNLDRLPGRTFRPRDRLLPVPQRQAERLPAGTTLLQAFDETGGLDGDGLLVLGEPGAGKTTLLFELARRLAERALTDPRHPVPVYLPLSSWATRRPRLDQWLTEQLDELYQIPRPLGRRWTAGTRLLFVLDGLDEIPDRSDRMACVKAINQFTRFGRSSRLPLVVASRPVEYDTLPVQLQVEAAIGVCPLGPTVVLDALEHAPGMQAVAAAVQGDPKLLELLRSPLLVSMLTLTYAGVPEAQIHATPGTPAERRQQLIIDYVDRRFELDRLANGSNGRPGTSYPPERTRAWLSALALYLTHHQQTVFLLGRIQSDWLPARWARAMVIATPGLIFGLGYGLIVGLIFGSGGDVHRGAGMGLAASLCVITGALLGAQPEAAAQLSWPWLQARVILWTAASTGLVFGLAVGLTAGLSVGFATGLAAGLSVAVCAKLSELTPRLKAALALGLGLGFGVTFGLSSGLIIELMGSDGPSFGLGYGLASSVSVGLGVGLAGQMRVVERLAWSWVRARRKLPSILIVGLVAVATAGLSFLLSDAVDVPEFSGTISVLLVGLILALITWLAGQVKPNSVSTAECLNWSSAQMRKRLPGILVVEIVALSVGMLTMFESDELIVVLLLVLLLGLATWLMGGLQPNSISTYVTPNEGTWKSIRNGLLIAMISGLGIGLTAALMAWILLLEWEESLDDALLGALIVGAIGGLAAGMIGGFIFGLGAAIQHGIVRALLWRYRIAPLRYGHWLNYTVRLRLLYWSASGGYVFIHRIVQDYFCDAVDRPSQEVYTGPTHASE